MKLDNELDSSKSINSALAAAESFIATMENDLDDAPSSKRTVTAADLRLVNKKVSIKYCEYKITNSAEKMLSTETISISNAGMMLHSSIPFSQGMLLRIWVEMPDFWARKSRHVSYRHTNAPSYFQVLGRVLGCEDLSKRTPKFQILCENVNLDPVDERVLCEFLGIESKNRE